MRYLPVIQTQTWLKKFVNLCEENSGTDTSTIQAEIIIKPLLKLFPKVNPEECQYELLNQGLFAHEEWSNIGNSVKQLEAQNVWQIVKEEYKFLRKLWNGPKVDIYIFPLRKVSSKSKEQIPVKNGVAYRNAIFLFLTTKLAREEIKALLAHEYNHICRLSHLDLQPTKIPLKDSLIIEGLGEYAVKDLYGEQWLAPWANLYSFNEVIEIWEKYFVPSLHVEGVNNHHPFLYGKDRTPFPKWIGYYIGYQIVNTYQKKAGPLLKAGLYTKTSDEIIDGSDFKLFKGEKL